MQTCGSEHSMTQYELSMNYKNEQNITLWPNAADSSFRQQVQNLETKRVLADQLHLG